MEDNKPGATIGPIFDIMKREHAESNIYVLLVNQIANDVYNICPGWGGLTSSSLTMEIFLEFFDSLYEIFTIEIHNPTICNLKQMSSIFLDRYDNQINAGIIGSLQVDDQLFIDVKYHNFNSKVSNVQVVKLDFEATKDGNNPKECEIRVFGRKVSGKDSN